MTYEEAAQVAAMLNARDDVLWAEPVELASAPGEYFVDALEVPREFANNASVRTVAKDLWERTRRTL